MILILEMMMEHLNRPEEGSVGWPGDENIFSNKINFKTKLNTKFLFIRNQLKL